MVDITGYISKVLTVEEYYIDKKTNKISIYDGYNSGLECKHSEGPIKIEASLYTDDRGTRYDVTVKHRAKKGLKDQDGKDVSGKKFILNFDARTIMSFAGFRDHIDGMLEKSLDKTSPFDYKCFRYGEANNKTEDDFTISVFACNNDIDITVNKDKKIAVTKYNAVVSDDNNTDEYYTFFNNGYRLTEYQDYHPVAISDMIFHEPGAPDPFSAEHKPDKLSHYIVYYDEFVDGVLGLPDLGVLPNKVTDTRLNEKGDATIDFENWFKITRDENGLISYVEDNYTDHETKDSELFCIYEAEDTENGKIVSSLTLRFYDQSNLGVPTRLIYELDQIDFGYDNRYTKYTRSTFEVEEDEAFQIGMINLKQANPDVVIIKQIDIPSEE